MMQDEHIGAVARKIMFADDQYDPEKTRSKKNWLILNGKWAIYKIVSDRKKEKFMVSLDENLMTCEAQREHGKNVTPFNFEEMLNMGGISDDDKRILTMKFVEGITDREIGEKLGGITKQAVLKRRVKALGFIQYGLDCNQKESK